MNIEIIPDNANKIYIHQDKPSFVGISYIVDGQGEAKKLTLDSRNHKVARELTRA